MKKPSIHEIWKILNKAVHGKQPVYDLATKMLGLDYNTVMDIAEKIHNDIFLNKWNWRELTKNRIYIEKENQRIEKCSI